MLNVTLKTMTSIPAHINPCPEQLPLPGVSEISPFALSLLTIYYQELVQYCRAHLFCVDSSIGHLMQDLTVDLISIYPKGDSGAKTQKKKISNPMNWWIWSIPDTD